MLETSVRLLRLLSLLQARRDWSGADLAARLDVTTRTVRNDIERLRILGYQVHSTTGTAGGYRLGAGTALPPLLLDDDEAVAVAVGLRAAAGGSVTGIEDTSLQALAKLEQTLPARLRGRIDALRSATVSAAKGGPTVDADTLTAIAGASRDNAQLRFDYLDRSGESSLRRVEPHRLVYTGRRWYLLAWDTDRDDWRTFRADRIRPRSPNGPRFTPREPPDGDAAAHVLRGLGLLAWEYRARVRLHAPAEAVTERITPGAGILSVVDEDTCLLQTGGDSLHNLASFLGALDIAFTVLDPPELRAHLTRLAERYTNAARNPAEDADESAAHSPQQRTVVVRDPGKAGRMTDTSTPPATLHAYFGYRDAPAALRWLERAFGFVTTMEFPDDHGGVMHAELRREGVAITVFSDYDGYDRPVRKGGTVGHGSYVVLGAESAVDAVFATATEAGATVVWQPAETQWGNYRCRVADIEGYEWTFGTYRPGESTDDWSQGEGSGW